MDKLFCNHEWEYCRSRRAKFMQTGLIGEVVFCVPHHTFIEYHDVSPDEIYVFKNRGMSYTEFETVENCVLIQPKYTNIEDTEWGGDMAIYWK